MNIERIVTSSTDFIPRSGDKKTTSEMAMLHEKAMESLKRIVFEDFKQRGRAWK